jgi:integrase/recombinase XerD
MKKTIVNIKMIPDVRRKRTNDKFPIKLRVTYKSKRKYYGTGYNASSKEWETINSADVTGELRKIKISIAAFEKEALRCIENMREFSFAKFEYSFFEKPIKYESLKTIADNYINELYKKERVGTADCYKTSMKSIFRFKPSASFADITVEFLENYEAWMLQNGKSITTVGINLISLRTILNIAKDAGIITQEQYPFGKRKYVIPKGKNIKKSLNIDQIKQIFDYPTFPKSFQDRSKDFWIFSYLCNGINMMDIAKLKWKNISKETITFERTKTKSSLRDKPVQIVALRNNHIDKICKSRLN